MNITVTAVSFLAVVRAGVGIGKVCVVALFVRARNDFAFSVTRAVCTLNLVIAAVCLFNSRPLAAGTDVADIFFGRSFVRRCSGRIVFGAYVLVERMAAGEVLGVFIIVERTGRAVALFRHTENVVCREIVFFTGKTGTGMTLCDNAVFAVFALEDSVHTSRRISRIELAGHVSMSVLRKSFFRAEFAARVVVTAYSVENIVFAVFLIIAVKRLETVAAYVLDDERSLGRSDGNGRRSR